jgi:hypothetical protein
MGGEEGAERTVRSLSLHTYVVILPLGWTTLTFEFVETSVASEKLATLVSTNSKVKVVQPSGRITTYVCRERERTTKTRPCPLAEG